MKRKKAGFMAKRTSALALLLVGLTAAGCEPEEAYEEGEATFSANVSALTSACAGSGNPFPQIEEYLVCGQAEVNVENQGLQVRKLFERTLDPGATSLSLKKLPTNTGYEVTVVGMDAQGAAWLGRQKGVGIAVGETANVDITLTPYNDTACIDLAAVNKPAHRIFPASVLLADGRIFVSGGFAFLSEGAGGSKLTNASTKTFFVDPATGAVTDGPELHTGRGAHAMVYLPNVRRILVIGGAQELTWAPGGDTLAVQYDATAALNDIEVIQLADADKNPATPDTATLFEETVEMPLKRVFPQVARLGFEFVVITGGGAWPQPESDYKRADFYHVQDNRIAEEKFAEDLTARSAHTLTFVKTESVTSGGAPEEIFLLWGGTTGEAKASFLVHNTSSGSVNFVQAKLEGEVPDKTFFHTMTTLRNDRLLAVGGVSYQDNKLGTLDAFAAYRLGYSHPKGGSRTITVEKVPGFPEGRVFHTASPYAADDVAIIGGLTTLDGDAATALAYYDGADLRFVSDPQPRTALVGRAGHAAVVTASDAVFLAGGVSDVNDLKAAEQMLAEILVPPTVRFCDAQPYSGQGD
jgi:hypothetical protein